MYKSERKLENLILDGPYNALPVGVRNQLSKYYNTLSKHISRRLTIMARESSIQLIYQNSMFVYEFVHPSTLEIYYQGGRSHTLEKSIAVDIYGDIFVHPKLFSPRQFFLFYFLQYILTIQINNKLHRGATCKSGNIFSRSFRIWSTGYVRFPGV